MSSDPNRKKKGNKWLALINIPIQMGVIVFVFAYAGKWLDEKYPNENNIYVKTLVIAGVAVAIYNVNRQVQEINKSDDE
ncbi:AtpZ/AtpI family protein [Flavobacterium sp. MAH-1]|uniref:AtpZ/AtpI family protein n=1 Tax=Flavobacterium agri TaxID=2743471 RepID=A0A7Y9C4H4_9FLAO|nr:AtpZ/AtpI family protein [Flavobacterium agri]NUY80161.1 AtpZ/AtpI family protein [Flavobacterium agri]NYA70186.1 AtpZ/AtpI family protein [Flavobacterium agri]